MKALTNDDFQVGDRVRFCYPGNIKFYAGHIATVVAINHPNFPNRIVIDFDDKNLGGRWGSYSGASLADANELTIVEKADIYDMD